MDISLHFSIPPSGPLPPLTTSLSLTISPSTSPKSGPLHITNMRRTVSASSPANAAAGSPALDDVTSLPSAHTDSLPTSAETSFNCQDVSPHAPWPANAPSIERTGGTDEDDYAWYFRNPHRYIRRPRPGALRHKSRNILACTESQRYSQNGGGNGSEVNMRLFAAYVGRHYAATPLSATFNVESEPTRACATGAQTAVGPGADRFRAGECNGACDVQGDRPLGAADEKALSDNDGASTIFSTLADDWDAPTLTNGSLRNSKLSCDTQRSSWDASPDVIPYSPAVLPGSSYVEVGSGFRGFSSSWDLGSPAKLIGTSYVDVGMTDCRDSRSLRSRDGDYNGQDGTKDDIHSSSVHPNFHDDNRKDRGDSQLQRFSLLRIFS